MCYYADFEKNRKNDWCFLSECCYFINCFSNCSYYCECCMWDNFVTCNLVSAYCSFKFRRKIDACIPSPFNQELKNWQCICLLPICAVVCSPPALFALSLILHWHLAATVALGIVVSLSVIIVAIYRTVNYYKKEKNFKEGGESSEKDTQINITTDSLDNDENNIKRCNSLPEKDINKSSFYDNFFQEKQDKNKNESSSNSLPLVLQHKEKS